eukprot:1935796-Pleurochrysis_carterae.AAC.2
MVQVIHLHSHCLLQRAIDQPPTEAQSAAMRCPDLSARTAESLCRPIRSLLSSSKSLTIYASLQLACGLHAKETGTATKTRLLYFPSPGRSSIK